MEIFGGKTLSLVFLKLELGAIEIVFQVQRNENIYISNSVQLLKLEIKRKHTLNYELIALFGRFKILS